MQTLHNFELINLRFYLQEVLKPVSQRSWEKTPMFTAPNTDVRDPLWSLGFIFSITTLKYQWKSRPGHEVSLRLWEVQWFQLRWLEAGSGTAPPQAHTGWWLDFLKTVQDPSVWPILSSQTMALKPGPHGNIQVFCPLKLQNQDRHIDCSCEHRGQAPGSWKHSPRTMRGVSRGPCLLHYTRPCWVSSNLPKICSHIQ